MTTATNVTGTAHGGSGKPANLLPDIEFETSTELRDYCNTVKNLLRGLALELDFDARTLQANLGAVRSHLFQPEGRAHARARNTVNPLYKAVDALVFAASMVVKCEAQFERNYEPELQAVRGHRNGPSRRALTIDG